MLRRIVFGGIAWFLGGLVVSLAGIIGLFTLLVLWPLGMLRQAWYAFKGELPPRTVIRPAGPVLTGRSS